MTWTFERQWGGVGTGNGQFSTLSSIACSADGSKVYAGDDFNNRVQQFDSSGNYVTTFDTNKNHDVQSIAVSRTSGDVFTAANTQWQVQRFQADGTFVGAAGSHGTGAGQFQGVEWVSVSPDGTVVLVGDFDISPLRVQAFTNVPVYSSLWKSNASGFDFAPDGTVWYVNSVSGHLVHAQSDGTTITDFGTNSWIFKIDDAATYRLYVPDPNSATPGFINVVDQTLSTVEVVGSAGSGMGTFAKVADIAVRNNIMYVADEDNHVVQKFTYGSAGASGASYRVIARRRHR